MIGFEEIYKNLSKAIAEGKLHHAIILAGNKGAGKFEFAKLFAKELLDAKEFRGEHPDLKIIEKAVGKKNISVDQVRFIAGFFQSTGAIANKKIVIVNKADDLNNSSSNALLKTLEEPNKGCYLILICDSLSRLLPTIKSRCQIYKSEDLSFDKFKEAFYKLRPDFLPKLSDDELKVLSILSGNSARSAFKSGEDLMFLYNNLLKSIENGFLDQDFLKKIADKSFDFGNLLMIFEIFFNRLLKFSCDAYDDFTNDEKRLFENISNKKSADDIFKTHDECRFLLDKTISLNLDKKLSVINCFNLIVS